jgi:hypothetical protein
VPKVTATAARIECGEILDALDAARHHSIARQCRGIPLRRGADRFLPTPAPVARTDEIDKRIVEANGCRNFKMHFMRESLEYKTLIKRQHTVRNRTKLVCSREL